MRNARAGFDSNVSSSVGIAVEAREVAAAHLQSNLVIFEKHHAGRPEFDLYFVNRVVAGESAALDPVAYVVSGSVGTNVHQLGGEVCARCIGANE